MRRTGATIAAIVAAVLGSLHGAPSLAANESASKGRITGGVEVGFDSFREQYSIVDSDTVDSVNEFRSRLRLGYATGSAFRDYVLTEGHILVGDGNYETGARLRLTRILGASPRSRFSFDADYLVRRFGESSVYDYSNDISRFNLRTYLRLATSPNTSIRISERLESINFAERTAFDYDYLRNHVAVSGDFDWGLSSTVATGLRFTSMSVPDSTNLEYVAWIPSIQFRSVTGANQSAFGDVSVERRLYDVDSTRSSFWTLLASGGVEIPVRVEYSIELKTELESYRYDVGTGTYFDYVRSRTILLANYVPSWNTKIGLGPTFGFSNSPSSAQDEYSEYGIRFRFDYNRGTALWLSGWYEPGKRKYPSFDPDADLGPSSTFSNYTYHRVSIFATVRIRENLSANMFMDFEPEDHERRSDDATATLLSVSLSHLF